MSDKMAYSVCVCLLVTHSSFATEYVSSITGTTDYVQRGLSQNSERPALQFGLGARRESGVYAHLWLSSLDTEKLAPDFGHHGFEANVAVGIAKPLSHDWGWELSIGQYETNGTGQILDYDYTELQASLNFRDRIAFTAAYSPRATDHTRQNSKLQGKRIAGELSAQWPVTAKSSLVSGIGYSDLSEVSDVEHTYWRVGWVYQTGDWTFDVSSYGTDSNARSRFVDGRADTRIALSIVRSFRLNFDRSNPHRN